MPKVPWQKIRNGLYNDSSKGNGMWSNHLAIRYYSLLAVLWATKTIQKKNTYPIMETEHKQTINFAS